MPGAILGDRRCIQGAKTQDFNWTQRSSSRSPGEDCQDGSFLGMMPACVDLDSRNNSASHNKSLSQSLLRITRSHFKYTFAIARCQRGHDADVRWRGFCSSVELMLFYLETEVTQRHDGSDTGLAGSGTSRNLDPKLAACC